LMQKPDAKMTVLQEERAFHIDNPDEVYKIFLADRRGNKTTLERKSDHWVYNGQYRVRQNMIDNLLDAMKRIRIRFLPAKAAVDNVIKTIATEGIKVEIYGRSGNNLKTYYIGGMTNDEFGTYMIMDGSNNPFVMHIPNWQGGLRARFEITGDDWRDRAIFRESPDDISSVSVEYPKQKSQSFKLDKDGSSYAVKPFYPITKVIDKSVIKGRAEGFLYSLENLQGESFLNSFSKRDSISASLPFVKITVNRKDGSSKAVNFHPIIPLDDDGSMLTDAEVTTETAVERYHVSTSEGDFMVGQHLNFRKVFWGYPQFFE
ncbi:MAG: DUF4340 domain-containing protein, partial [Bacteroidota bacterium]